MNMNDRTYELITFWLIAAHFVVSLIMLICNWKTPVKTSIPSSKKSSSKKGKNMLEETTSFLENYTGKVCSILKNNKVIWSISVIVCAAVCVLLGLCIWGEEEMEVTTEMNK